MVLKQGMKVLRILDIQMGLLPALVVVSIEWWSKSKTDFEKKKNMKQV
jgi:hypothetical protein